MNPKENLKLEKVYPSITTQGKVAKVNGDERLVVVMGMMVMQPALAAAFTLDLLLRHDVQNQQRLVVWGRKSIVKVYHA